MLRDGGGTIVVSGSLTVNRSYLAKCSGPVTVTSVYGGVDYRKTNAAKITFVSDISLSNDFVFDNLEIGVTNANKYINCRYNNFTVGNDVICTGPYYLSINGGYLLAGCAIEKSLVSCHSDCTISVASGTWGAVRGGNIRSNTKAIISTVDADATLTVNISGGKFVSNDSYSVSATGMNGCCGNAILNISGGEFAGSVSGLHRIGASEAGDTGVFSGNLTVNISGGTFSKQVTLNHGTDSPSVLGNCVLNVKSSMQALVNADGFYEVNIIE